MALPFIEIIEWVETDPNLLMHKFVDADKEIKNGAQLTVRENQAAMLLNEGQLADVFSPGLHKLSTANIPVISRLKGWKYGFESPFKADVYFFATRQFINLKWGTPAPILLRDPQFGQVRLRAFGSFAIRIADVATFFRQYAGTYPRLTIFELEIQMRDFVAPKFGEVLAQANISVLDVAGNISDLSSKIEPLLKPYFENIGIELTQFIITSATLPPEVTEYYDKVTSMNMIPDMNKFQQFNQANAIGQAGTAANEGMQQGIMAGIMLNALQQQQPSQQQPQQDDMTARLQKLKVLYSSFQVINVFSQYFGQVDQHPVLGNLTAAGGSGNAEGAANLQRLEEDLYFYHELAGARQAAYEYGLDGAQWILDNYGISLGEFQSVAVKHMEKQNQQFNSQDITHYHEHQEQKQKEYAAKFAAEQGGNVADDVEF